MILRTIVGVIGVLEVVAPRRVVSSLLGLCCRDADEIEVRSWVVTAVRLEGLLLVGLVLWQSRDALGEMTRPAEPPTEIDVGETPDSVADTSTGETEEHEATRETDRDAGDDADEDADLPTLTPDTRRFQLASVLFHADEPLTVRDFVDLSEGTDWELGRSPASTTLYRMFNDGAVDREEGPDGAYEYWLTDPGRRALEAADADPSPDPFATAEP